MDELKKAILEKSIQAEGKIKLTCSNAFALAEELDVKVSEIARICREEDIRICKCQLNCF